MEIPNSPAVRALAPAWNKGRIFGQKHPLKPKHVWAILRDSTNQILFKPPVAAVQLTLCGHSFAVPYFRRSEITTVD